MRGPIDAWAHAMRRQVDEAPAFQRDPEFIERLLPWMESLARYFDAEVRGFERLPARGPMLLVGNHSGGALTPDTSALIAAWCRQRGVDDPLIGLGFDAAFSIPGFRTIMRKIGQVPASMKNAGRALEQGAAVLVYPGGAHEVFRPWRDRNRIDFNGHKGFIRLALRHGIPVVPVVGHGGHETTVVLARGERIARALRLDRLRMRVYPILLQFPWGVSTPAFPSVPLPAKITVQICDPIDWTEHGADAASDEAVVQRCYEQITSVMQAQLDALSAENPRPLLGRLRRLLG